METNGLPIYGLACPNKQHLKRHLSPNETKCGCTINGPTKLAPIDYGDPVNTLKIGSQVYDGVTGNPFEAQTVHIQNMTSGKTTVTKPNGHFVIEAYPSDLLQITHVGYGSFTVEASELTGKVILEESFENLDTVVLGKKPNNGLVLFGLATVFAIVYASADDSKTAG